MKNCPQCHANLADDAMFCTNCGIQLNAAPRPQQQPPKPPQSQQFQMPPQPGQQPGQPPVPSVAATA